MMIIAEIIGDRKLLIQLTNDVFQSCPETERGFEEE